MTHRKMARKYTATTETRYGPLRCFQVTVHLPRPVALTYGPGGKTQLDRLTST